MYLKTLTIIILILSLISCSREDLTPDRKKTSYISGKLYGYDGKPMPKSLVTASIYNDKKQTMIIVPSDKGVFQIPLIDADFIELEFAGVNHRRAFLDVFHINKNNDIDIKILLEPNSTIEDSQEIKIIGNFNDFSFEDGCIVMKKLEDGTYSAMVPNKYDTLFYQILGAVTEQRSINGTMSAGYIYDGGGDWRSFVISSDSIVNIIFDPRKMMYPISKVKYSSNIENFNHYLSLKTKINDFIENAGETYTESNKYLKFLSEYLVRIYSKEEDSMSRFLISKYFIENILSKKSIDNSNTLLIEAEKTIVTNFFNNLNPGSAYCEKCINLIIWGLASLKDTVFMERYINNIIGLNPSKNLKPLLLYNLTGYYHKIGNKKKSEEYYKMLIDNYSSSDHAKWAKAEFSPDKKIISGKLIPDFNFINLDNNTGNITANSLKGKYYLIDIWATWCGPCVGEMENLDNTFKKFKRKNFGILSISIDNSLEDVMKFRKGKWKMPWLHSFSKGIWKSEVVDLFEVTGIPKPILINPEGKILEIGNSLRGESLIETLNKYLK